MSKKITQLESNIQNIGANSKLDSDNTQDINIFDQSSSLNLPKEEVEQKNQENFVEVREPAEICAQEDKNISRETNDNQMIDLNTLPIESLREIFYRRDTKNNKLSDLKEKYNENNKQELIKKILSSSLKI